MASVSCTQIRSVATGHITAICGLSSTDVMAVGSGGTIIHYDGTNWESVDSGETAQLSGIWGASATEWFASSQAGGVVLKTIVQ